MADSNGTHFVALDIDKLKTIIGQSRTRNAYGPKLVQFMNSDEAAISVRENWNVEFGSEDKKAESLYQGFRTAAIKAELLFPDDPSKNVVEVKKVDTEVYLLHRERVALVVASNGNSEDE